MGRQARGVRGMNLEEGDYLVGMEVVENEDALILSISEHGFGKRTALKEYRLTNRGGKGVINMKTTTRNGKVVAILAVKEDTDLMIVTKDGKIIRLESAEIRQAGRSTQGVRLVRMEEGDRVAAASVLPDENGNGKNGHGRTRRPAYSSVPGHAIQTLARALDSARRDRHHRSRLLPSLGFGFVFDDLQQIVRSQPNLTWRSRAFLLHQRRLELHRARAFQLLPAALPGVADDQLARCSASIPSSGI